MQLTHQHASWTALKDYPVDFVYPSPMQPYKDYVEQEERSEAHPRYDDDLYARLDVMDKQFVHAFLRPAREFIEAHDVPLYCGEYGVIDVADAQSRANWTRDVAEFCLQNGIGRAMWSYRGMGFTMVDREGKAIDGELVRAAAKH